MDIDFRSANSKDLPSIQDLFNFYILNSHDIYDEKERDLNYMKNWWKEKQEKGFPVLIAELEGRFAGFASFGSFRRWEGYKVSVEHSVYVKEEFHGNGIGKELMHQLISLAKEIGLHSMIGGIDSKNRNSLNFHTSLGFKEVGRIPEVALKNKEWLELVLMQKII